MVHGTRYQGYMVQGYMVHANEKYTHVQNVVCPPLEAMTACIRFGMLSITF